MRLRLILCVVFALCGSSSWRAVAEATSPGARIDSAAREIVINVGPESLGPAGSMTAMRIAVPQVVSLPIDGWLRSVFVDVVDSKGRLLPRKLLHHANVIAPEQRELFSPIMLRIGAAGPETDPIQLPRIMGLRVHRGDSILVTVMLSNPSPEPRSDVWVRVRLGYVPDDTWLEPIGIRPFYLDVMPPAGNHSYDLPAGHSERSWEGRPAIAGRVLVVGGHLHQYGVALRFRDVTEGRDLWVARPTRDSAGEVLAVPTKNFLWRGGVPLRPDHVYRLTAVYENPTGRVIPDGAMGTLGGVFLPGRGTSWPRVARSDPQYRYDVQVTYDTTVTMNMARDMEMTHHEHAGRSSIGKSPLAFDIAGGGTSGLLSRSQVPTEPRGNRGW